jgi:SAM-dependent methyltransferase
MDCQGYTDTRFPYDPRREPVWQAIAGYLRRYTPGARVAVEIGAAYCHLINNVNAAERHAVDLSDAIAKYVASPVVPHVGSCTRLPQFADRTVDVVYASNLFEHLTSDELSAALTEVRRILRPGGRLIVIQPNFKHCYRQYFDDYTHVQVFTDVSLRDRLLASSFAIVDVQPRFLPFSMHSRLPASGPLVAAYLRAPFRPFAGQMLIVAESPVR